MGITTELNNEITNKLACLNLRQKKAVLLLMKTMAEGQKDWWNEISEEQQAGIDMAVAEMQAGKLTTHEEIMKKYKKWVK
ncbi:MAG: hypothetical protein V4722_02595 [Bacteroidota bacterium]